MAPIPTKPGVLLVHPRLRSPNKSNADTFYRWTKLHYQDLLNIPADAPSEARIDACVRGVALEGATGYSHEENPGLKPTYMYTCFTDDIGVLKSQPYYDVSRQLNLELARPLGENEEPVGYKDKKAMVFDIVDAKFAVYEQTEPVDVPWDLRRAVARAKFSSQTITRIDLCTPHKWDIGLAKTLKDHLETSIRDDELGIFTGTALALYRWAGEEAQPDEHPLIDVEERPEWMILAFAESSPLLTSEKLIPMMKDMIGKSLQKFAEGSGRREIDKMLEYGVWEADAYNKVLDNVDWLQEET